MTRTARFAPRAALAALAPFAALLLALTAPAADLRAAESVIHEENSLYRNILVRQRGDERCLLFTVRRADRNQSCIDLSDPDRLVFPYARTQGRCPKSEELRLALGVREKGLT